MDWEKLVAAAHQARRNAHAPYSRFQVGAALVAEDGNVYTGCNVENSTFGLTVCAERTAVCSSVAAGAGRPLAIAVVADLSPPARPCALCLGTLAEFAPDLPILLVNLQNERHQTTLRTLLPEPFVFPRER
ncbi:MAG TPA: cytidine deaminase [Thermoanaerobaculia bacterium]|mgnify:CR=1 FL=1|nr:cytidine deaminase [Thermoanaerobaculia bacterium]